MRDTSAILESNRSYLMTVAIYAGMSYHAAEDAVQDLFVKLLKGGLSQVPAQCAPAWLATRLRWDIAKARRDGDRQKRGGLHEHVELEPDMAVSEEDPARLLDRRWLYERLISANTTEDQLLPERGSLTAASRVSLCRLRKRLRPLFTSFLPS